MLAPVKQLQLSKNTDRKTWLLRFFLRFSHKQMNYGCLDIKGYVASVNQAEPFEIYCLRGILHLIGRKKGRNFSELALASVPAVLPFVPR